MKKTTLLFTSVFIISLGTTSSLQAQKEKGKSVVTGGVGFSLVGAFLNGVKDLINTAPGSEATSKVTPVLAGMYDYALADQFTLGAAYTYQSITANYNNYYDSTNNLHLGNFQDKLSRQNFAVRALFHFGQNEKLDMYTGLRLGYTKWTYTSPQVNVSSNWNSGVFSNRVWPQALFGMRYFFIPNLGFNMEFAIGPTYYAMLGINAQF